MKSGGKDFLRMAVGALITLGIMLVALHFHNGRSPAEQLAFKAKRVDLVERMRLDLASASEAEKSAVLATTDEDSQKFADQALTATAQVEKERKEMENLLATRVPSNETDLLAQFSKVFAEFQSVDKDVLALAVKNTNLKAYSLAFGPAADALNDMNTALSHLVTKSAASPEARSVALLAFGAQTAALRIQALLAPHIAEESDAKMDAMEARMTKDDQEVHHNLDGLAALPIFNGDSDLAATISAYARFSDVRAKIIPLSRENTNVRSLAISLNQKRKVMLVCQDTLATLQQAILDEPIPGVDYGRPVLPR